MTPYMPEVDAIPEQQAATFSAARLMSGNGAWSVPTLVQWHDSMSKGAIAEATRRLGAEPIVALVTPGRMILPIPCPPRGSCSPELSAAIRRVVPEEEPQAITVIAFNDVLRAELPGRPEQQALTAELVHWLVPFLGYLLGMASAGHRVIVFEGHSSALALACRDADLLIVDEAMLPCLQPDWARVVSGHMRKPRILVFGRDGKIVPLDATSAQPLAAESQDLGRFEGLVRAVQAQPLPLLLVNPASYLSEKSASSPQDKKPWWWPFG